ncbi:sugar ABC transporter substrate-binding protein [Haloactinopolyspora sp.]|uniref:ABC transporter substrate-binding protein n=1 Tax=Haloactinopolyspora sp. TaxID=1966353 RepID=UPI0026276552|nr:sugar ABC transporter substrate-binding protein [Haloactinopolyspora sp.]
MVNRNSVLVLALAAPLLMTACGGGDDGPSAEEGGTLTIANWQWLEPTRGEAIWAAVQGYEEQNPEATLQKQEITRADYENTLQTQIGAGEGPDLMVVPNTFFPMLAEAGALEPLDGVLDDDQLARLNSTNEDAEVDGEQLGFTWEVVNYAFFWNQTVLDEAGVAAPTTPEELVTAAQQIQQRTGVTGFGVRHLMNEQAAWWTDFAAWPYGFDGGWSDGENLTIDSDENIAAVQAYKAVYDSGAFPIGDDASTMRSSFAQGQLAMMIDNSAAVTAMIEGNDAVGHDEIGVSSLPFPGEGTVRDHAYIVVNANSEHTELAKDFIRWLYTEEVQEEIHAAMGASALGADSEPPADYVAERPWVPMFLEQTENSRSAVIEGFETQTAEISTIVLNQISRILTEDVPVDEALAEAQASAEEAVQ